MASCSVNLCEAAFRIGRGATFGREKPRVGRGLASGEPLRNKVAWVGWTEEIPVRWLFRPESAIVADPHAIQNPRCGYREQGQFGEFSKLSP